MSGAKKGFLNRIRRAAAALTGNEPRMAAENGADMPTDVSTLRSRVQELNMDMEERDKQIRQMRKDYELLRQQAEADRAGAEEAGLKALAKRLAPLLSQGPTIRAMHGAGKDLKITDMLMLFEKIEGVLEEAGLEPIGTVGETTKFDTRLHQRMSGGDVDDGVKVKTRFVGYRFKGMVMTKAMVSREG